MELLQLVLLFLSPAAIAWFGRKPIQDGDYSGFFRACIATWLGFSLALSVVSASSDSEPNSPLASTAIIFLSQGIGLIAPAAILRRVLRGTSSRLSATAGALPLGLLAFFISGISGVTLHCAFLGCG